jgi:hypothetical protein
MPTTSTTWVRDTRTGVIREVAADKVRDYHEPVDHLNKPAAKSATTKEK